MFDVHSLENQITVHTLDISSPFGIKLEVKDMSVTWENEIQSDYMGIKIVMMDKYEHSKCISC